MDENYSKNVFINCPYDSEYIPIKQAIIFAVSICGFIPKLVSMDSNGTIPRIEKIKGMIKASKYSIHDISRCKASKKGEYYRLNMPFELGMDLGCRYFSAEHSHKNMLVLSESPYAHQPSLSDYSGYDPQCHHNKFYEAMDIIRDYFYNEVSHDIQETFISKRGISFAFDRFQTGLYADLGGRKEDLSRMSDSEYYRKVCSFMKN